MNKLKKTLAGGSIILLMVLGFIACDDDFNTIGDEVIENNNFTTLLYSDAEVRAYNKRLTPVQTNGLPVYQLGKNVDPIYGTTRSKITVQAGLASGSENPRFGDKSKEQEDESTTDTEEMETVTKVYLNIPFFSTRSVNVDSGEIEVRVDSLYGNLTAPFTLKVQELTYFLRDTDVDGDPQAYYSNQDFSSDLGVTLYENTAYEINQEQIEIPQLDDEGNAVLDGNGNPVIARTLSPRIRVELDPSFFQTRIIDNEGDVMLSNNNVFKASSLFRGLHITVNDDADILMLLDFEEASVEIEYEYQKLDTQGTTDTADDEVVTEDSSYTISLSSSNIVNTFNTDTFLQNVEATEDNLYLKGGEGSISVIELFGADNDGNGIADQLEEIRENNWIINDANLVFYIDDAIQGTATDPNRIYLYNMRDNIPLQDYVTDQSTNPGAPSLAKVVHGGIIERDDTGNGISYKVRITEHINNLLRKDSTNIKIGLAASSDIRIITSGRIETPGDEEEFAPTVSIINPFGTVLHGSTNNVPEDKRLKLEIFYTVPESN